MKKPMRVFGFLPAQMTGLAGASGLLVAGRLIGTGASFLFTLVLARTLAPADVGAVMTVISSAFLASILVTMNVESGAIRYIVEAKENNRNDTIQGFVFFGRALLLAASPVVLVVFAFASFAFGGAVAANPAMVWLAALSIPVMGWLRLSSAYATAVGHPLRGSLPRTGLQPIVLLTVYASVALTAGWANVVSATGSFLFAFAVTAVVQLLVVRSALRADPTLKPTRDRDVTNWRNWIANGLYLSPLLLLQENLQYTVVIAATFALQEGDVAVFAIALRFVAIIRFGVLAVNLAASPRIARAIARGDIHDRDRALRDAAILKAGPALGATLIVVIFAAPIMSFFGGEYASGATALRWFTLIPLVSALLGPNQMLLNIAGDRLSVLVLSICALAALFTAVPLAGSVYGVNGAALATAIVYVLWEIALYVAAKVKTGADASILSVFAGPRG